MSNDYFWDLFLLLSNLSVLCRIFFFKKIHRCIFYLQGKRICVPPRSRMVTLFGTAVAKRAIPAHTTVILGVPNHLLLGSGAKTTLPGMSILTTYVNVSRHFENKKNTDLDDLLFGNTLMPPTQNPRKIATFNKNLNKKLIIFN